ncbi:MAG: hypothetical protein ACQ9MH_04355 [Nitrospinales bacterium]
MSVILKALKKLEDEKQYIDDGISLDEFEVHSEDLESSNSVGDKILRWRGKILLVLTGILFGGIIGKLL